MVGEDFRSAAAENLIFARELEGKIELMKEEIGQLKQKLDDRELELVVQERVKESHMMEAEEILTRLAQMRVEKENLSRLFDQQTRLANERQLTIEQITAEYAEKEKARLEGREEKEV